MNPKTVDGGPTGGERPAADPVATSVAAESAAATDAPVAPGSDASPAPAAEDTDTGGAGDDDERPAEHASEQLEHDVVKRDNVVHGRVMLHVVTLRNGAIVAAGMEYTGDQEPQGDDRALWKQAARTQTDSLVEALRDIA